MHLSITEEKGPVLCSPVKSGTVPIENRQRPGSTTHGICSALVTSDRP